MHLDERGRAQAEAVAARLAPVPLAAVVTEPAGALRGDRGRRAGRPRADAVGGPRLAEFRYGDWTGKPLKDLAKQPLWKVVQAHPSAAVFPGRGGGAGRHAVPRGRRGARWDARITARPAPDAVWLACSHGDMIKAVLADALGLHLDLFQRIVVDPCSVTVVRYTAAATVRAAGQRHRRRPGRAAAAEAAAGAGRHPRTPRSAAAPGAG